MEAAEASAAPRPRLEVHAAAPERRRFDHLGHPLGGAAGHDEMDEQPDHQAAQRRHQQDVPPGKLLGEAEQSFGIEAEGAQLDQADQVAEGDGRARGEGAQHHAEDEHHHLPVADHPA